MIEPRSYRDPADLDQMRAILIDGRKANNGTYYVHVGDVNWWLFYPNQEKGFPERIFLWEDDGDVIGWALFSPRDRAFDLFVHPSERGSERAEQMLTWTIERMTALARRLGHADIRTTWVFEDDAALTTLLQKYGFARQSDYMLYHTRSLAEPIPALALPEGYAVSHVTGEREAQKRAAASHAAFGSKLPFEAYWPRYLSFTQSPVYEAERDLIVVAPDPKGRSGGRVAAFCIYWPDSINKVGLFEPVGTHPDFQQRGLGKAVVLESLRRMKASGMTNAIVGAEHDNPAAQRLYLSAGFQVANKIWTYSKNV